MNCEVGGSIKILYSILKSLLSVVYVYARDAGFESADLKYVKFSALNLNGLNKRCLYEFSPALYPTEQ